MSAAPKITLPELPEPDVTDDHTFACHSDDLIREYGLACLRAGMEAAAQIAETRFDLRDPTTARVAAAKCADSIRRAAEGAKP